jgi:hypothetical protein
MTQSQTQTAPVKLNALAAIDKKIADEKAAAQVLRAAEAQAPASQTDKPVVKP